MEVLTVKQAADQLSVTPKTIQRWIKAGYFPGAYRKGIGITSAYLIPAKDIEQFKQRRKQ